ncbi:hypothetical protein HH1059_08010 [Halorhodospira halochloris]|uniref:Uncharacterized protein n=1 Tax=Halorhodospira halochloris TaxID=1052 RepID=A0A110B4Z8_HALHR|nr:hypothetical protein HH1059_08010 [Halorhodospira halochloris]
MALGSFGGTLWGVRALYYCYYTSGQDYTARNQTENLHGSAAAALAQDDAERSAGQHVVPLPKRRAKER